MNKRIEEIDVAKGLGLLLVILGHSFPDANIGIQSGVASAIFSWIYSFHMPLFMTMAGMLFSSKIAEKPDRKSKIAEIRKRAERLLIPYSFYSILMLGIKDVTNLGRTAVDSGTIIGIFFGSSPCGNMWFLWTLFMLSVVMLLLPFQKNLELILIAGVILYFLQNVLPWFDTYGLSKVCGMFIWFVFGMVMMRHIQIIKVRKNLPLAMMIAFLVQIGFLYLSQRNKNTMVGLAYKLILSFAGICFIWLCSNAVVRYGKGGRIAQLLMFFGRESMAFYILSYFVQTPCVTLYSKVGSLGVSYTVWVAVLMFGSIAFTITASALIKKNRILKKILIGG